MSEMSKSQMLIGGEWLPPASKDYFESFNPYTGKPWKLIARGCLLYPSPRPRDRG